MNKIIFIVALLFSINSFAQKNEKINPKEPKLLLNENSNNQITNLVTNHLIENKKPELKAFSINSRKDSTANKKPELKPYSGYIKKN